MNAATGRPWFPLQRTSARSRRTIFASRGRSVSDVATECDWKEFTKRDVAPVGAVKVSGDAWVHKFTKNVVTADFDDFVVVEVGN